MSESTAQTAKPDGTTGNEERTRAILAQVRRLAVEYRCLTGKPLGITGEVAEYIAAEKLGLRLAPARTAGHDAVRKNRDGSEVKIQIKGRACGKKPKRGLRMGRIKRGADCESVVLVLLDDVTLDPHGMWEAPYAAVEARQLELRTEKGLRVTDFKKIAKLVWPTAAEKGPSDARSAHVAP